jgi:nucleoid-associated protein YgaU
MKLLPWLVFLSLSLVGCSGSKSSQKVDEDTPQIELSDADEFIDTPSEEAPSTATVSDMPESDDASDEMTSTMAFDDSSSSAPPIAARTSAPVKTKSSSGQATAQYTVQKNETLMMIAFKLYGDYARWKELANSNRDALKGSTVVREGMSLKYVAPEREFVWNPQGSPYLIRTGDTLGGISRSVYNTVKRWKLLWENNRPLIKDPNKIFAGFTIYYTENGREVAAEM